MFREEKLMKNYLFNMCGAVIAYVCRRRSGRPTKNLDQRQAAGGGSGNRFGAGTAMSQLHWKW